MRLLTAFCAGALVCSALLARAGEVGHGGRHCPRCHEPCYPTVTKVTESKHCWNVELKTICIPKITFPWESHAKDGKGCAVPAKCGRTKTIRVLVKEEYECSVCKYAWDPSSFKAKGLKADGHGHEAPAKSQDEPAVAAPKAVEAGLKAADARPITGSRTNSETSDTASESPARSYFEILTGFFQ